MEAVILPIIGVLMNITLITLFCSKKHIINEETKIYSKLLFLNLVFLLIGLATFVVAKITNSFSLIAVFQKTYMSILVLLNYFSIKYCFSIFKINTKIAKIINNILVTITIIAIILIFILPLNVIFYGNVLDGDGLSYNVTIIYSVLSFIIFIVLFNYLLHKKASIVKIIPFLILIILYLIGFILRAVYNELIFEGFFYSYILLIMYHTIENPDLKMLNQVTLAKNQVEKSNKVKSEFISSMSHEIRTPLNAIVGYSQMIDYAENLEEAKENAKDIVNASNTLLNMLSNVLDISMVEANSLEIKEVEYDFNILVNDIINLFKYKIEEKNLTIKLEIRDIPNKLIGDSVKIKRILANLLDNAIKYTDKGKITLRVNHKIVNNICNLEIIIEDTGKGIDDKIKLNLFNNFIRADENINSNISGMGLGLSITKSLVDLMGGSISCESKIQEGTKFIVKLPQKRGE